MTYAADARFRPAASADYREASPQRSRGILLAVLGLGITTIAFFGNLAAVGQMGADQGSTLAWTFGLTTTGFAVVKTAIAVVLWGIILKLWVRADSMGVALPKLTGRPGADSTPLGDLETPYGKVTVTEKAPDQTSDPQDGEEDVPTDGGDGFDGGIGGSDCLVRRLRIFPEHGRFGLGAGSSVPWRGDAAERYRIPIGNHPVGVKDGWWRDPRVPWSQGPHPKNAGHGEGVCGADDVGADDRSRPVHRLRLGGWIS